MKNDRVFGIDFDQNDLDHFDHISLAFGVYAIMFQKIWKLPKVFLSLQVQTITRQVMSTESMTQKIADYFKTQPVLKAWLFGSFARGEQSADSDIDILVVYDRSQSIGLFKLSEMHLALEDLLGKKVDLVEDEMLFPWIADSVNRDKKLIYERAA